MSAPEPELPPPVAATALEAAGQLDGAVFEYRRILALAGAERDDAAVRRSAIAVARELALVGRALSQHAVQRPDGTAIEATPPAARDALRSLEYAFVALAQDPVDEPTLLRGEQLDAVLLRGDVGHWLREVLYGEPEEGGA
jgi:hypothetical protein